MKLETKDLEQFRQIWKDSFQSQITSAEAEEKATFLLEMMNLVYCPLPKTVEEQLSLLEYNASEYEI